MVLQGTAHRLASNNDPKDAAIIYDEYLDDAYNALHVLVRAAQFVDAVRIAGKHNRWDLINNLVVPTLLQHQDVVVETIANQRIKFDDYY